MQIVIIDDEKTNCKLLEIYTRNWGYNCISFTHSIEAYEYLEVINEPAVVCVDWMMPEMSGLELLAKIREKRPDFPLYFIVLTAKTGQENIVEALDAGADDYVSKPFDSKELRSRIGAGQRVITLEHKLIEKDQKLIKTNNKLQSTLHIIEQDVKAGKAIQFKLLPKNNKTILNYTFSRHLEPSLYLSGDFLDYYTINGRYIGFYFIDVAGHGASSAFVTIFVKSFISNYISKYKKEKDKSIINPALVVDELNERLLETDLGKHLTIFFGLIDNDKNELVFCNGGQFPFPILVSEEGSKYLKIKGFPVGLMPKPNYKNEYVKLPETFKLFLFSDGLLEILPAKGLKEQQQYILDILNNLNASYTDLMDAVNFKHSEELPDDITCMAITKGVQNE
ncbi:MAG: PP2C family protein-serine/threonine phosphatase [Fidelibacterota bacterium]